MKIRRTIENRMKNIQALGRGRFNTEAEDGKVIFSTNLEGGRLDIYLDSFTFGNDGLMCRVFYKDIISINSHLGVELFSAASRSGDLEFFVPLEIACGASHVSLSVPFLTYSNVMNVLIGLQADWMAKDIEGNS
ncbi:hypothetical protein Q1J68_21690 [Pseudomonas pergaminensis]|uniref:hypothetical protein n=1 Tax=Pseudomonas pergaminensis TaxID=2853159 RepID=UPI0034D6DA40